MIRSWIWTRSRTWIWIRIWSGLPVGLVNLRCGTPCRPVCDGRIRCGRDADTRRRRIQRDHGRPSWRFVVDHLPLALPMREMKDRPGHREQAEHDHQQRKGVIDPGNCCGVAAGCGPSVAGRCERCARTLLVGDESPVAAGVSSLTTTGTVSSALAVCGAARDCIGNKAGVNVGNGACGVGDLEVLGQGDGDSVAIGLAAVAGTVSAGARAGAAITAFGERGCCGGSGSEAVASSDCGVVFWTGSPSGRAASTGDCCWRGRSGSTSADLVVLVHSAWRDIHRRRALCVLLEMITRRSRQE